MDYEETKGQVTSIFTKVKALHTSKKRQLRRAYGIDFDELNGFQQLIVKDILTDTSFKYSKFKNFIVNMCSMYLKQGCKSGKSFETYLKYLYENGSATTQQKIGCLMDENDKLIFTRYREKYAKVCSKDNKINIVKLTTDVLCWPYYGTREEWMDTITEIQSKNQKKEGCAVEKE